MVKAGEEEVMIEGDQGQGQGQEDILGDTALLAQGILTRITTTAFQIRAKEKEKI